MPEPIIENEKTTEEIQAEVLGKKVEVVDQIVEEKKVEEKSAESSDAIKEINEKIAKQTEILNSLLAKQESGVEDKEWTLEQLRDAEAKVHSGEYETKWLPLINEKRATIIARQIANEEKTQYTKENQWADINTRWNNGMVKATEDFGKEAADTNSKLFKMAQELLFKDPGYKRFHELKSGGKSLNQIDPTLIDPDLQYKCFEIAHSRLTRINKDNPNPTPSNNGSKQALGGPTLPKPDADRLKTLEERALNEGGYGPATKELMMEGFKNSRK